MRWQGDAAWMSTLFLGLAWLRHGEVLRMYLSLTGTIVTISVFVFIFTEYPSLNESFFLFYGTMIGYLLVYAGITGFVLGDDFYDKYLKPRAKLIGWLNTAFLASPIIFTESGRTEFSAFMIELSNAKSELFEYFTDQFGSEQLVYLAAVVAILFIYMIVYGNLIEHSSYVYDEKKSDRNIKLTKFIGFTLVCWVIYSAFQNTAEFPALALPVGKAIPLAITNFYNSGAWVLILTLAIAILFYINSMATWHDNNHKKGEEAKPLPGKEGPIAFVSYLTLFIIVFTTIGFFKNTVVHSFVLNTIGGSRAAATLTVTKSAAEKAVKAGDFETAKEEYGYAVSAAGASGDLDELENLLDELEKVSNQ